MHVRTHRLLGTAVAFASASITMQFGGSAVLAFLCTFPGSTAPDWLEIPYGGRGEDRRSIIPHRTLTHYAPLWLGVLGGALWLLAQQPVAAVNLTASAAAGFSLGALSHLFLDLLTPLGIPLFSLRQRYHLDRFTLRKSKPAR